MNQKGLANAHKEVAVTLNIASKTLDIDQNKPSLYNELNYFNSDIETIRDLFNDLTHMYINIYNPTFKKARSHSEMQFQKFTIVLYYQDNISL